MSVTQFTDAVEIEGSQNTTQLTVQGHTTQTEPLQTWQNSAEDTLSQITSDGRFQVGDDLGMAAPDALVEAHRDSSSPSLPQRGLHTLGRVAGALSTAVQWAVQELELLGSSTISGIHAALRSRLTHSSEGDSSAGEFRAGDFEVVNQTGAPAERVGRMTALQATVTNETDGYLDEAVGIRVAVNNENTDETDPPINTAYGVRVDDIEQGDINYALHTGQGTVHLGDALELPVFVSDPDNDPPEDFLKVYTKLDGAVPKLYAKDASSNVHELSQGSGSAEDYILIRDEKSQGTSGGTFTSGAWRRRDLNTIVTDTGNNAALASNKITLEAGTYRCRITCPALYVGGHQARLYDDTGSTALLLGSSEYTYWEEVTTRSEIVGRFTLSVQSELEVQHQSEETAGVDGLGTWAGIGTEIYTTVELWKES